ncbi:MAG: 4'-phosphopantetheinyl transferase superfamily protein [Algoriphagus sp.]|nr:4'-phosphopantetheinyl transferase superfamily protein [Algoriphagus sp.]
MQKILRQYRRWEDAHLSLMGKILLKEMAYTYFNLPDILHQIRYSDFKKPEISTPLSFSISHSGNRVVCAISDAYQLGLDVEQISEIEFDYYQDYMSLKEWEKIHRAPAPNFEFLRFWTQKESAIKADGRGLNLPLHEMEVQHSQLTIDTTTWYLKEVNLAKDYVCHLATDKELRQGDLFMEEFRIGQY